jgi:hypothetical protein
MASIFANTAEEATHAGAIVALATEIDRPADEVRDVYEDVYRQLSPGARVRDFLPLFVSRRAREVLRDGRRREG